ncbi:virulence RhuM family protein [Chryseobacterium sp. PMSZPI]|uniref:virulence RhuM family protein n=1 Tax=Chryseobacterium sp. PMSZPI TaxID=1033900 RepID=UPI000C327F82|nr:virulence RhuM family protein [Chryseobacterium sp. PMSZPI]PKF75233.1 cell filamentation protein Fic [Chryseobacterium sp. PMSZPI]
MEENVQNFILYTTPNGDVKLEVLLQNESVWLTQKAIAELFGVDRSVITKHLGNIYETNELQKDSTSAKIAQVQQEGSRKVNREMEFYNLDAIISVGYRVNSSKATQFRIWATQTLKDYIIKGFVLDDNRLKQGQAIFGKDYFKELLQRIRSIRASERRIYQQVTDIFAECSIDYDKNSEVTQGFYAMVQNKFHYAITGKTAPEIIYSTADKSKDNMGLTTWKNAPDGRILKQDIVVAKNYLQEKEIQQLERTVTGYFDYIEGLIERQNTFTMQQLAESVNKFLSFNEYKILEGKGNVSKIVADKRAIEEYEVFNKTQRIISDFDKEIQKITSFKPKNPKK